MHDESVPLIRLERVAKAFAGRGDGAPCAALREVTLDVRRGDIFGIAQGAFEAARGYTLESGRPWLAAGVDDVTDDPYIQHRYGQFWLMLRPAAVLADQAGELLDAAFRKGEALSARERGEVAVATAEAKVLAHRAAIDIGSQLFELTGARSTSARYGFDRYWRNARVHTLHDPVDYKLRDLGRYALLGRFPEPTPYS